MIRGIAVSLLALLLLGCSNDEQKASAETLVSVESEAKLLELLKGAIRNNGSVPYISPWVTAGPASAQSDTLAADSGSGLSSTTNLQVSGVDEADLIKNDNSHLFIGVPANAAYDYTIPVDGGTVSAAVMPFPELVSTPNKIRILKMLAAPVATEVVSELEIGVVDDPPLTGFYLQNDQQGVAEKLIAVSSSSNGNWFAYGGWQEGTTLIQIIDVTDPATPVVERRVEIDGNVVSSRRIDNLLYLVTRYSPALPGYVAYPYDAQTIENNEQILSSTVLADLMPNVRYDNGVNEELLAARDCYITEASDSTNLYADLITLTVLDLNTSATENSRCFIGATETIFISQQAAYLATSQYNYSTGIDGMLAYDNGYQTDVHKFLLHGATATYQGSEQVEGHLGWDQDKKSFRMGEQGEHLVVVTSLEGTWDSVETTKLTIIKDDPQNGFATINTLPNSSRPEKIGKPGEKLYSVRIIDGVAYLVTFRVTDPLYVIDLNDPADPFIAGELQIDGYSDYLHPLPNGMLLGVGKDAVPDTTGGDEATGAWYQGVKLSLFDVSDWSSPVELNSMIIGNRGSESAVLQNHHAFTILPGDGASRPTRIAVPIDMHDTVSSYYGGEPWEWYNWTHTGLYLYELDTNAINPQLSETGKLLAEVSDGESYFYGSGYDDRSVLSDVGAYYIHNEKVWSAPLELLNPVDGPK